MKWMHALLAAAVVAAAGCGQTESKPPPGAEDTATSLEVDISGDDATGGSEPKADAPPAAPSNDDVPPGDLPASKSPTEADPPAESNASPAKTE